ncbi:hypothetical protein [Gordonia soli]|uniref:Uncharacterized protein n=1 Tax=Gordonia soli NBRC 108243 TaxID=1223545 RepID=M0QQ65_9ACTN|nr:hypothetical protein [Gordonia soli]GAC70723.1 hypothetical protein GS4_39_00540 [Gordonia soli NBRC 108243]
MTIVNPTHPLMPIQIDDLLRRDIAVHTWIDANGVRWPLRGGATAFPAQWSTGAHLEKIKGISAPLTHVDQQGAHQDGTDWLDSHYDKMEIDFTISLWAPTITERRRLARAWNNGWQPRKTGRWVVFTHDAGEWWVDLRSLGEYRGDLPPDHQTKWTLEWSARSDDAFWQSFPSVDKLVYRSGALRSLNQPADTLRPNMLALRNRGNVNGWPDHLLQGPGTFTLGDNGANGRTVSIQVKAGELVKLTTLPRKRTAIELNSNANVYPRLKNRFATPVPPPVRTNLAGIAHIPVTVTGATTNVTSITSRLTPYRDWPE